MPELVVSSTSTHMGVARELDLFTKTFWGMNTPHETLFKSPIEHTSKHLDDTTNVHYGVTNKVDVSVRTYTDFMVNVDTSVRTASEGVFPLDVTLSTHTPNDLTHVNTVTETPYINILPYVDLDYKSKWYRVNIHASKPHAPADFKYLPTGDFNIGNELIGFTGDFVEPIDYDKLVTPLSPVDSSTTLPWKGLGDLITFEKSLTYGYSVNAFIVSGGSDIGHNTDEDAIEPPEPPTEPETGEVIRLVNIINVVALPSRTPINFSNFTLAIDLESVAWVVNFDIADLESLALVKPSGLTSKEVEIDINGEIFTVFIGRTSTSLSSDRTKGVQRAIRCTGWSTVKQLSYPYSPKRSHNETSSSSPAGLLSGELTGTGFTGTWNSVSWTIPANVFSYFEKTPLAAISELAQSVGAVIVPSMTAKSFTVEPYYPISPWNWDTATPDYTISEASCFSVDTEWIPQESPDSVYVYGEETGGIAVKCVKLGTAGLKTLPTIVDKYITDTIAGVERGRIEVAKNGFKEVVPVTTYIDGNGIIMPQSLLEVNALDGSTWRGMVVAVAISVTRNGSAVVQRLSIERHYDN